MRYTKRFEEVRKDDVALTGGKGANLGEPSRAELPVPPGFILTTVAYDAFVGSNDIGDAIVTLASIPETENPAARARRRLPLARCVAERSCAMVNISGTSAAGKRTRWAKWIGYAACGWSLLFSLVHLYWGIEGSTGRATLPGGATAAGGRVDGSAWALYAGILCLMGVLVVLLRFRSERMPRWMQRAVVGTACAAMTAYVVYAFAKNGFQWLIAPGILFAAGSVIALALIQPWGRGIPRPLLLLLAWVGGAILILKTLYGASVQLLAVTGVITWQQAQTLIGAPVSQAPTAQEGAHMTLWNFLVWNPWFLLGGVLFCVLAWLARRDLGERLS